MRRDRSIGPGALVLALLLGCSSAAGPEGERNDALAGVPVGDVVFASDRAGYRQGEVARVTLRNEVAETVGYNLCQSSRELRVGGGWRRIEPLRMCTEALDLLAPGEGAGFDEPITAEWEPGSYRMVTWVYLPAAGTREEAFTGTFTVER